MILTKHGLSGTNQMRFIWILCIRHRSSLFSASFLPSGLPDISIWGSWQKRQQGGVENVNPKVIWPETKSLIYRAEYREL